ncbi:MAG TPA: hypothetical protein VN436_04160 [Holophaga sp.]|nr:hypothetical protein [Holophaga sp.]
MRFVHRPTPIEAVQFTCSQERWSNTIEVCHFLHMGFHQNVFHNPLVGDERYGITFVCGQGLFRVYPGDWIVRDYEDRLMVMDDVKFQALYQETRA